MRRGLRAAAMAVILGIGGAALAEVPRTAPVPRPISLTATATAMPQSAVPAPETGTAPALETALTLAAADTADTALPRDPTVGAVTGFPIPRYVSIKAAEANARRGPSRSHRIDWVFQRRDMPVMVVAEHGHWRRVVDRDGVGGWVHYTLLSGERTAIVEAARLPLYQRPDTGSMIRAEAERGVIGSLRECHGDWCEMEVAGFRGWVEVNGLWGVDPGESFD
ncbi:SH3 domain-containing protein [Roseicyclus marinus]